MKVKKIQGNLYFRKASSIRDYFSLRSIRNSSYATLSNYPFKISIAKQLLFWLKSSEHDIYLFSNNSSDICYILLKKGIDSTLITIVVKPEYRNSGVSFTAISYVLDNLIEGSRKVIAEILNSNTPSKRLFEKLRFIPSYQTQDKIYYEYNLLK